MISIEEPRTLIENRFPMSIKVAVPRCRLLFSPTSNQFLTCITS